MPSSRHPKRTGNSQKAKRVRVAAELRHLVAHVKNQEMLDAWLLQEPDPQRRQAMFKLVRPMLKFPLAQFPTRLHRAS